MKIHGVEDEIEQIDIAIKAAEQWAFTFERDKKSLAKLIKLEAKLERVLRRYLLDLANERAASYVNWSMYAGKVRSYSLDVMVDVDEIADVEESVLLTVIHDPLQLSMALGAQTSEKLYNIDLGLNEYHEAIMKSAQQYTAELVTNITNTTKERIQRSISQSIELGEDGQSAIKRMQAIVGDPRRAEMIARTEAVRSYTKGIDIFGRESGATHKVWDLSSSPCELCQGSYSNTPGGDGVVPFDDGFDEGDPPRHPNCRCSMSLIHDYS